MVTEIELLFQMKQLISDYTRVNERSATTIDLIFTNIENNHIDSGVIPYSPSDHLFVYTTISFKNLTKSSLHKYSYKRNMKNYSENSFLNDINDSHVFGNIGSYSEAQQAWLVWKNEFLKICNKHAPIRLSRVKNTCSPWITNEILDSIYYRNYLHKKAIKSKKLEDFTCYRKAKNSIALKIKTEKKSFYAKIFSTSNSSHKFWNTVKTIIPNKNKHFVNQNLTATKFNKYFSSIGTNITKNFNYTNSTFNNSKVNFKFIFNDISSTFIFKCLSSLGCSSSMDILEMDTKLLKIAARLIAPSFAFVCNLSLRQGVVPLDFKLARVTPIYKGKGNKSEYTNHRPISVVSHLGKILEKAVKHQLVAFLTQHSLLSQYQMAYINGRSTQSALNFLINSWLKNIDSGMFTTACLIDLSKCFDCIHHKILFQKLKNIGITDTEFDWFCSYLYNRKQVVYFNNELSPEINLNIGIPQGTVLGPILFLIYMNELTSILPKNSCVMYADDITIYSSATTLTSSAFNLQNIINTTVNWINENGLNINVEKSNCIIIGSKDKTVNRKINLTINGNIIKQITEVKLLGLYIDDNLTWKSHCDFLSKKISQKLGLFKRLRTFLPLHVISNLYFPLIQSLIDYGITLWGNCAKSYLSLIQKLQNRTARIITQKHNYTKYSSLDLRRNLNWMSVTERYSYFMSILMFQCINNPVLHKPLSSCFTFVKNDHNYPTRHSANQALSLPRPRTEKFKRAVSYSGVKIWNNIPLGTRTVSNVNVFKKRMKHIILDNI